METRIQAVRKLDCAPTQVGGTTRAVRSRDAVLSQAVTLWDKFPEPRGWALQWDGVALADAASERRNGGGGRD